MRATAAYSVREGLLLGGFGAAAALDGASLQVLPAFANPSSLVGFDAAALARWQRLFDQYYGWHFLVPTDPGREAMWVVDPRTGTTVAVSLDGSGASCAQTEANAAFQAAVAVFQTYLALAAYKCEPTSSTFACVGGITAAIYAGVAAIFAGILLKNPPEGVDILAMFISTFIGGILAVAKAKVAGNVGFALQAISNVMTVVEVTKSVVKDC